MYRILYRESPVYDPRSDRLRALDVSADLSLEDLGELRFTLPASNPWCGRLAVMSKSDEVVLEDDGTELFRGRVTSEEEGFDGSFEYSCEDQRAYLNDVLLPVYSAGDGGVPDTPDGLFAWYVSQYNAKVPPEARFEVGVNEGAQIGRRGWIYRASSVRPTVWEEVRSKLVDELGGVVRVRSERGRRYIDWLADGTSTCSQRLEFGRNLLDFARRRDGTEVHTRVVPWSRLEYDEPAAEGEERPELLDIAGVPDRPLAEGFEKVGDAVVNVALERVHGVIEASLECEGVTNPETLVSNALQRAVNEAVGDAVEISAYDLHRRFPDVQPIRIGDFVRVTAKPRGYDAWMLCHSISLRPSEPSHTYRLGTYAGTYTSAQSRRLSELNSAVGEQASVAASVSSKASAAVESALTAREAAERAEAAASTAVTGSRDEYALSSSRTDPPNDGWASQVPERGRGQYVWRRTVVSYGGGSEVAGVPAVMSGDDGEDATLLRIDSSRGTVFKNSEVNTVLTAVVYRGSLRITDASGLASEFGAGARLEWSWQRMDEDRFGVISSDDSRIGDGGFTLTLAPDDVDTKAVFACTLITE